jgi:CheY-like chemotaxis protein
VAWTTDADLRFTGSYGGGLLALGLRQGQVVGMALTDYFGTSDLDFPPLKAHRRALGGEPSGYTFSWNGRDYQCHVEPLGDAERAIGVLGVAADVTAELRAERGLREREDELRRAQKLEALGRAAREAGQEIAREVGAAEARMRELLGAFGADDPRQAVLVDVARSLERLSTIGLQLAGNGGPQVRAELTGGETILLVDDEPTVRGFVKRALELYGYRVIDAGGSQEALSLGSSFDGRIHLLLADVVLPGMSGPQLAARLAPLRPEMRILYMTGFADDAVVDRGVVSAGQPLLVKPFTSVGLAHEVKKVLRA